MGLKYYAREANNGKDFPSLSPSADIPLYANLSSPLHHRHPCSVSASSIGTSSNTGTYANIHTYASVPNRNAMAPTTRAAAAFQTNNYFNISTLSSKMADLAADTTYAKLVNSISNTHLPKSPSVAKARKVDEKNTSHHEAYGDIGSYSIATKVDEPVAQQQSSSPSAHTYINFERQDDTSPGVSSPSPINESKHVEGHYSPVGSVEKSPLDIETNSSASSIQVSLIALTEGSIAAKKLEVNMAPNCGDKSVLYRTKIPYPVPQIHPVFRPRRTTLHRSKRRRRRSTTPFRSMNSSQAQRRQKHHSNIVPSVPQTKTSHRQRKRAPKSVSNRLYNIVPQPLLSDSHSVNSVYSDAEVQVCDYPVQFHGALQHHIIAWYPTVTCNEDELIPQVVSASENGESRHHSETIDKEEEFLPHDTFEDFLLRRPRKSSSSPSTSRTSSASAEVRPVRPPPLARRSSGVALGLDKNDVDFIHNIIQRTQGDQRVSNRIAALREAYVRAAIKENDLLKAKTIAQADREKDKKPMPIKRSVVTSKIRDELERYDELPIHRKTVFDEASDDDDDDTYSANIDYRYHRRALPPTPSTAHRILHFITAVKRQFQKSFHDFRSRVLIETMTMSSNHVSRSRHTLHEPRRYVPRPKTSHEIVRRSTTHHPTDQLHRQQQQQQLYRTHSNNSQFHHTRHHPAVEPQPARRTQIPRSTPRQQRPPRRT